MKKALTKWYLYLIGLGLGIIISCISIIPHIVATYVPNSGVDWPFQFIGYCYFFSAVICFGIGFIWQDIYRAHYRHKTKNWSDKLPDQILETAWTIFIPFIVGALIALIAGTVHYLMYINIPANQLY